VRGFVDLHSHWIASIDDGTRSPEEGIALLKGLYRAGFSTVVATPHMRPGMFDNDRAALEGAYAKMAAPIAEARARGEELPEVRLASEHFFDDVVYERIIQGHALPYPRPLDAKPLLPGAKPRRSILVELPTTAFPARLQARFFDMKRAGYTPVLAHPERYQPVWKDPECLEALIDAGAHLLLDVCSLVGKYGRASQKAAETLLDLDAYEAACSDAHKPADADTTAHAIDRLTEIMGDEETERLLGRGPRRILEAI
jgi:protein-tyrosine phosphatase